MRNLTNIKDFNSFVEHHILNESLNDGSQSVCNKAFINGGLITFGDGSTVHPKEIVNVVNDALAYLADQYTRTFKFGNRINIIFLAHSNKYKTMTVDEHMNMYMNAGFIYHTLKMDKKLVAAVIMHEILHVLFNHIERGKNWLGAKGKPINNFTWNDNNLAADVEVNQTLVRLELIDEDTLINIINGIYLKNLNGFNGKKTNTVPMETILDNEDYMNKLRSLHPAEPDPEKGGDNKNKIKTSEEWDNGYKDGWNKIAGLIKKYGYEKVWDKLIEAGIINGAGEMKKDIISDIKGLEYMQVKSFDEYMNESFGKDVEGQTYDDGFNAAVGKLINKMRNAMNPGGNGGGGGSNNNYDSNIDPDELEDVNIPEPENDDESGDEGDDGLPDKTNPKSNKDNQDKEQKNKGNKKQGGSQGGSAGKSDDEITDDDLNKLADDLKNKNLNGGGNSSKNGDPSAVGGTGSFISGDDDIDDVLKDAGYSEDEINEINEIREKNKERNSTKGIEKARQEMRNNLNPGNFLAKMLNDIDIESAKYKNVWKEVMEKFLANKTRRAGTKVNDSSINWKRKSRIALGQVGPQYQKVDQDPQDVNMYVDVSGSMDLELLEVISKSLLVFSKQYKYSGINICPWASVSNGISRVDGFNRRSEDEVTDEILKIISKGSSQCGGGTNASAAISAMIDVVVENLNNPGKKRKDDVHVVITDGEFDYNDIESRIEKAVSHETERQDVGEKTPVHTFWMIYDAPESLQDEWKKEIKKGKLIFINSETVKNNK